MSLVTPRFNHAARGLFLATLAATGNASAAARAASIGVTTANQHRAADPVFAAQWDEALEMFYDEFEAAAAYRAQHGVKRALWYKGEPVIDPATQTQAFEVVYSDSLVPVLLKAQRPERHRDRSSVDMRTGALNDLPHDEVMRRAAMALAEARAGMRGEGPDGVTTVQPVDALDPSEFC